MERFLALIIRVRHILGDRLAKHRIGGGFERLHSADISAHNDAAGQIVRAGVRVERQVGNGKIVRDATADLEPLRIHRRDGADIDQINLIDEFRDFGEKHPNLLKLVHAERALIVQINRVGHSADQQVLDVRGFRSQHADDLESFALILQRLNVVGEGKEVSNT